MYATRRQASGGLVQQAIAAIENAMLDVKARAAVSASPVYEMLGCGLSAIASRLYWSHAALIGAGLQGDADPAGQDTPMTS